MLLLIQVCDRWESPEVPGHLPPIIKKLLHSCLSSDPAKRPTATQALEVSSQPSNACQLHPLSMVDMFAVADDPIDIAANIFLPSQLVMGHYALDCGAQVPLAALQSVYLLRAINNFRVIAISVPLY